MNKDKAKAEVAEYVEIQRGRIEKSRNARKWFYRGVLAGAAALVVYARLTDNTETETEEN